MCACAYMRVCVCVCVCVCARVHACMCVICIFNVVMEILRRYYTTLCHSLPSDYMKCVAVLNSMGFCPHSLLNQLKACGSSLKASQLVIDSLIRRLDCEERLLDFCDVIDWMVEDELKHNIESFRNGVFACIVLCIHMFIILYTCRIISCSK